MPENLSTGIKGKRSSHEAKMKHKKGGLPVYQKNRSTIYQALAVVILVASACRLGGAPDTLEVPATERPAADPSSLSI